MEGGTSGRQSSPLARPLRVLVCGLGHRGLAGYLRPLVADFPPATCEVVGLIDVDPGRIDAARAVLGRPVAGGGPDRFERIVADTDPDTIIVASPDSTHHPYVVGALELGRNVLTEKPLTVTVEEAAEVCRAEAHSDARLAVAFNLRWDPVHQRLRQLVASGAVGRVTNVEMTYNVDTYHGPSYFLRWNRYRALSGGLSVTKGSHHFDLVSWIIDDRPVEVFAFGALNFYGRAGAVNVQGRPCPYEARWQGHGASRFGVDGRALGVPGLDDLDRSASIYDPDIEIEDTYSAVVRFARGASLAYSTNFSAPWEGYVLAVNGTEGRLETRYHAAPDRCRTPVARERTLRILRLFGPDEEEVLPDLARGHVGADRALREALFRSDVGLDDPRWGAGIDGARAVAVGEGVWRSAQDGTPRNVDEMLGGVPGGATS